MNIPNLFALTTGQRNLKLPALQNQSNGSQSASVTGNEPTQPATPDPTPTVTTPSATTNTGEEFSTFLTLLTAQIRNQDPLAPLDSTQFVEQLATFSSLELQAKGNNTLEDIASMLAQQLYQAQPNPETPTDNAKGYGAY